MSGVFAQDSSYSNLSYYTGWGVDVIKNAAYESVPIVSVAQAVLLVIANLNPVFYYDDGDEEDAESRILYTDKDIDSIAHFYVTEGLDIKEELIGKVELQNRVEKLTKERLTLYQESVKKLNQDLGTTAQLGVALSNGGTFSAAGGTYSISNPVIVAHFPRLKIETTEQLLEVNQNLDEAEKRFSIAERKFILAHEMMHIKNNDPLACAAIKVASAVATIIPWIISFTTPMSLVLRVSYALLGSFAIGVISNIAYGIFSRYIEERADKQAMNYLQTNEGALIFFNKMISLGKEVKIASDYLHPTLEQRLKYAAEWK